MIKNLLENQEIKNLFTDEKRHIIKNKAKSIRLSQEENRQQRENEAYEKDEKYGEFVRTTNNLADTLENIAHTVKKTIKNDPYRYGDTENIVFSMGDHLFVNRFGYTHHGIYIGNGAVIHYLRASVQIADLKTFADGEIIQRKDDSQSLLSYTPKEAVLRAYSRLGEDNYNLFTNNCESFVRWCRNGGQEN
ncbi:MAG: hypothetical protein ATN36_06880 [Epulopiscium sp. Nele67-Bin005]|nr:MAG: hypothetical protein ATN36_06880 [Epulopiscium sp. Nele67-Bin005]